MDIGSTLLTESCLSGYENVKLYKIIAYPAIQKMISPLLDDRVSLARLIIHPHKNPNK